MFVVDASVTMAWCFEDEAAPETEAVLDRLTQEPAIVPAVWPLEVSNVLLVAERRGRLNESQTTHVLELLASLPIDVHDSPADMSALVAAGRGHGLSAYDAAYLLLAERLDVGLATRDTALISAARDAGVPLLLGA